MVLADTSVIVRLTRADETANAYREMLGSARLAVSFQVEAELMEFASSERWGGARKRALAELQSNATRIPHEHSTSVWYALVMRENRRLRRLCGDADLWIVAQALEHDAPLMMHDRNQARLAEAVGVAVQTQLT